MSQCALKMSQIYLHTYPEEFQTLALQSWKHDILVSPTLLLVNDCLSCYSSTQTVESTLDDQVQDTKNTSSLTESLRSLNLEVFAVGGSKHKKVRLQWYIYI